jgi:hypothetical protein
MSELSEYDTLLRDAYLGEVFGDAFFGAMAAKQPDRDRREKLSTLQTVEARTATSLRRLVHKSAFGAPEDEQRANGEQLAAQLEPEQWDDFVRGLLGALPDFLRKFERLVEIAKKPTDPALVALVNHEHAIEQFAQLEVDGDEKHSMKPLTDHLRKPA